MRVCLFLIITLDPGIDMITRSARFVAKEKPPHELSCTHFGVGFHLGVTQGHSSVHRGSLPARRGPAPSLCKLLLYASWAVNQKQLVFSSSCFVLYKHLTRDFLPNAPLSLSFGETGTRPWSSVHFIYHSSDHILPRRVACYCL